MNSRFTLVIALGLMACCAPCTPVAQAAPAVSTTTAQFRADTVHVTPVAYRPYAGYYRSYRPNYGVGYGYAGYQPYYGNYRPNYRTYNYGYSYVYPSYRSPAYFGYRYPGAGYRAYYGPRNYGGYRW